MSSKEDANTEDALTSLMHSCASIRKRARSIKTRASPSRCRNRKRGDLAEQIEEEQQTALFLDRKIFDYKAAILRHKKRQQASVGDATANKTATKASLQEQRLLRSQLVEESLRQQREALLLSRVAMAQPAGKVAFAAQTKNISDEDVASGNHQDQMTLVQETIQCRNRLVEKSLATQRQLDSVRKEYEVLSQEGARLKVSNQEAWKTLKMLHRGQGKCTASSEEQATDAAATSRLAEETKVLKRALAEIISFSDLDWYSDQRIQNTLLKLES